LRQLTLDPGHLFAPLLSGAPRVLVAVSGGPDSMALLHLLAHWPKHPPLLVATVDHGLRPQSAAEAEMVGQAARALGLAHHTLIWQGEKPVTGIAAAARAARYALLEGLAAHEGCTHFLTAHHADDQAETVLMRLAAGSGPAGLAAMRVVTARGMLQHVRPLLGVNKAALVEYCAAHAIHVVTDPTNADQRTGRGRLRGQAAAMHALGMTQTRLATLAARMGDVEEALAAQTEAVMTKVVMADAGSPVNWPSLACEPVAIRRRVLAALLALVPASAPVKLEGLERLEGELAAALRGGQPLRRTLAERLVTLKSSGELKVSLAPARRAALPR
jgi:tRNA(Ile)-lysidine synthase